MNEILDIVKTSGFSLLLFVLVLLLLILAIINLLKINKLKKDYKKLMMIIGNGQNFNENLSRYLDKVDNVSNENLKLNFKVDNLQKNVEKCVQKIGLVRYNAFLNTGSDLCFALALLDFEDNGVVINGIYSRDNTTTTYAKPIEHGKSKYTLVKEEEEALEKAMHNGYKCFLDINEERM